MKKRGGIVSTIIFVLCMAVLVGVTAYLVATPRQSEPAEVTALPPLPPENGVTDNNKTNNNKTKPSKSVEKKKKHKPNPRDFLHEPVKRTTE